MAGRFPELGTTFAQELLRTLFLAYMTRKVCGHKDPRVFVYTGTFATVWPHDAVEAESLVRLGSRLRWQVGRWTFGGLWVWEVGADYIVITLGDAFDYLEPNGKGH
jgi:hypothetical protein